MLLLVRLLLLEYLSVQPLLPVWLPGREWLRGAAGRARDMERRRYSPFMAFARSMYLSGLMR